MVVGDGGRRVWARAHRNEWLERAVKTNPQNHRQGGHRCDRGMTDTAQQLGQAVIRLLVGQFPDTVPVFIGWLLLK